MAWTVWFLFCAVALVSILSPGPAILLAISNSVSLGWRRVAYSSLGNVSGIFVVASLAMTGLGALLRTSAVLFAALKIAGAAYLLYLGIKQWRSKANLFAGPSADDAAPARSRRAIYAQGLLMALTNPKAILFFTALFPQFIDTHAALLPQFLILTATFMALSFCSLMTYAALARGARGWFSSDSRVRWFNRTAGSLYMLLGAGLLRLRQAA
ncbi:MAG TPA: LysE family translocator [Burkholderiaceae bacterium]